MTEQQATAPEQEAQAQPTLPVTPETVLQIMQVKQQLTTQVAQFYTQLCDFIRKLPINPNMKSRGLLHFDDGILWIHEAIRTSQLALKQVEATQVPQTGEPVNDQAMSNQPQAPTENV